METKSGKLMTYDEVRDQRSQMPLRSRDHMRSRDKLKTKYSFFQKTYGHQTLKMLTCEEAKPKMKLQDYRVT